MSGLIRFVLCIIFLFILVSAFGAEKNITGFWHRVKWGENIVGLAKKYGLNPYLLAGVNNISDWNYIWAGDTLWIPVMNNSLYTSYIVKAGDYLLAIAQKTGISVWIIAEINGIFDLDTIYPGQEILIPKP